MRSIHVDRISRLVSALCVRANLALRADVFRALRAAQKREPRGKGKDALSLLVRNAEMAREKKIPLCQDTGIAVVFLDIGQRVCCKGGSLQRAVDRGVKEGYSQGYLRKSVVRSPLERKNTGTNAPGIVHTRLVPGSKIRIWCLPKGFGSENKSLLEMLNPTAGVRDIVDITTNHVRRIGADACPPYIIGIGLGGTADYASYLSKRALLKSITQAHPEKIYASLERKVLSAVNALDIGPLGAGGRVTALGVNVEYAATHIAGLPLAITINCHAMRTAYGEL